MIQQNIKSENSLLICPECKNTVDLSRYPSVNMGMIIECNHCGMTLHVKEMRGDEIVTDIVDTGK